MTVLTTRWWWVRHAPVTCDGGRIYGQSDLDCDCGEASVFEGLARALPRDAVWVVSSLRRTHQTAEAILAARGDERPALVPVDAFKEQHFGAWQGTDRAGFYASRAVMPGSYWLAHADERPPDGESFVELVERVRPAVERLTEEHRGRDVIAVAHGGTIRAALGVALGVPPQQALAFAVANCSLTRLDHLDTAHGRGWRVVTVNRTPGVEDPGFA